MTVLPGFVEHRQDLQLDPVRGAVFGVFQQVLAHRSSLRQRDLQPGQRLAIGTLTDRDVGRLAQNLIWRVAGRCAERAVDEHDAAADAVDGMCFGDEDNVGQVVDGFAQQPQKLERTIFVRVRCDQRERDFGTFDGRSPRQHPAEQRPACLITEALDVRRGWCPRVGRAQRGEHGRLVVCAGQHC